jgi:MFS family permease
MIPRLPRAAWTVLGGDALSALGTGMTLPFLLVYLSTVRGLSLATAGLALSTLALASFVGNPLGGSLADRFGARRAVIGGLLVAAAGAVLLALVREPWQAFCACAALGLGVSVIWPAQDALLAAVAGRERRSSVFSVRHATLNAGLGAGALLAARIVDTARPQTFTTLFLADAATYLAFIPILLTVPDTRRARAATETGAGGGLATILGDRVFLRVWALSALVVALSYGQFHSSFPAYATRPDGIPVSGLSLAFAANAITVVAAQLVVLRLLRGHRRTTAITLACAAFAGAWAITIAAGQLGAGSAAQLAFAVALIVFALAETLLSPTFAAIVNDITPDETRGRYNAISTLAWTTGFLLGPAIGAAALDAGAGAGLFIALIASCALCALGSRRLAGHLRPEANLIEAG